ncbi:MAG: acyloxyacyl hydrolase [Betaproteobacteria bacterium]|nr:acyloxyacyl hydrolase [Betaproteobacteria bacterium]
MKKHSLAMPAAVIVGVLAASPAAAVDSIALEAGSGYGTDMARVALQRDMRQRWLESGDWQLGSYWKVGLGYWRRNAAAGQDADLAEIGLTPVLRFQQTSGRGLYVEGGFGVHLLSRSHIGDLRLGTLVQFGSSIEVGFRFGDKGQYDLSVCYQHLSNADIKQPNDGIDFNQIRFRHHF